MNIAVGLEACTLTLFMLTSELGALGGLMQALCRSRHGITKSVCPLPESLVLQLPSQCCIKQSVRILDVV